MQFPTPGIYQHYKGQQYQVMLVAKHTETEEQMVVYRALYGERGYWIRPLGMFCETVMVDGEQRPRFEQISVIDECQ